MKTLSAAVRELAFEVRRMRDDQTHEHDKWALQLENAMLRFERRLLSEPQDHLGAGSGQAPAKD